MTRRRILVTGSAGYLGRALVPALDACGDVVGIDRVAVGAVRTMVADLRNESETRRAVEDAGPFDTVVHMAALAHGERPLLPETMYGVNVGMTRSLLASLAPTRPHVVFCSSVAVYGEDGRMGPVGVGAQVRPATEYGLSKLACERLLQESGLPDIDVLRLAPVFDRARLADVRKRVYLPGIPIKIRLHPSPVYSLCHLETVIRVIRAVVERGPGGRQRRNIADETPYSQHTLSDWFPGRALSLPTVLTAPVYGVARALPDPMGYRLRCLYAKLFRSSVYQTSDCGFFD